MEIIRRKTDYGLRCLADLAEAEAGQLISVHELAQREEIPEDLLHKVMQQLSAQGIVQAHRGRSGGFRLARPVEEITVLEVIEILQGKLSINRCFVGPNRCRRQEVCSLRNKLKTVQNEMLDIFGSISIADLLHKDDGASSDLEPPQC